MLAGQLPILTADPTWVAAADWLRALILIVGLVVAAVAAHDLLAGLPPVPGIRARVALIVVGSLYVCLTVYARLGEPVTPALPVGTLYQALALVVIRVSALHDRRPTDAAELDRRLRGDP